VVSANKSDCPDHRDGQIVHAEREGGMTENRRNVASDRRGVRRGAARRVTSRAAKVDPRYHPYFTPPI